MKDLTIFLIFFIISVTMLISTTKSCSDCNSITGKVNISDAYRSNSISVSLEGADRSAYLSSDKKFVFHNVPSGIYVINVNDYVYVYEQVLVEVTPTDVRAYQYNIKTGKGLKHKYPFEINPVIKIKYEEESANIVGSIIKSPYAIMIGVTVLLFVCMKMMPQDQMKDSFDQMNKQMNQYQSLIKK